MPALLVALAIVVGIQSSFTMGQDVPGPNEYGRFQLYNACRPMELRVLGNNEERLWVTAESRLRAARLYTTSRSRSTSGATLVVTHWSKLCNTLSSSSESVLKVSYRKLLTDPASGVTELCETWKTTRFSSYDYPENTAQSLSEAMDKFLLEYLRVNEKDCSR